MIASLLTAVCLSALSQGGADAAPPSAEVVARLIEQLDARRLAERQAAEDRLIELGPDVLELLPDGDDPLSAETRQRVERVRRQLRQARAEASIGPPRFELGKLALRPFASDGGGLIRVGLKVAWPATTRPLTIRLDMAGVTAVDETGRAIPISNPEAAPEVYLDRPRRDTTLPIVLKPPATSITEIARLSGSVAMTFAAGEHAFRFERPQAARDERQRVSEATVELLDMIDRGDGYVARVRVEFDSPDGTLASYRGWVFANPVHLDLPGGEKLEPVAVDTFLQTPKAVGVEYRFDRHALPEDAALVYRTPTSILTREFPFEFTDIRLP